MAKKKKATKTDEIVEAADRVVAFWMDFRKAFTKAFAAQPIAHEEEQDFLKIKSNLSRLQRILSQRMPEGFRYGSRRITEIMGQSISIAALRELPVADKKKIYKSWHESYIALQNLCGVLDVMRDGYTVSFEQTQVKSGNIRKSISSDGKEKKKSGGAKGVVVVIALLGAAGYYFYIKMK